MSYRTAVAKALPSVVTVHAARADAAGRGSASVTLGLATGVILERDGFIVTASQVVAEANQLAVALRDGTVLPARLVASHPDSGVALVKVDAEGLQPIEVGDPGSLAVGDVVLALGDPLGMGQTVTHGIISAIARKGVGLDSVDKVIQTDAAINPGHLGGALLDAVGRLIGINVAIVSWGGGSDGIALAIPVDAVQQVATDLKKAGRAGPSSGSPESQVSHPITLNIPHRRQTWRRWRISGSGELHCI